jgi:glycogen debranching enzyme
MLSRRPQRQGRSRETEGSILQRWECETRGEVKLAIPHPSTLLHGKGIALACGPMGQIEPGELHGLFAADTRVLSAYRWHVNGCAWRFLGHVRRGRGTAEWTFQNPPLGKGRGRIAQGALFFRHVRRVGGVLHDDLVVRNYGTKPAHIRLGLVLGADFCDIFEVKEQACPARRNIQRQSIPGGVRFSYRREAFQRAVHVTFCPSQPSSSSGSGSCSKSAESTRTKATRTEIRFDIALQPGAEWTCCLEAAPEIDGELEQFRGDPHVPEQDVDVGEGEVTIDTDSLLEQPFERGQDDLRALAVPLKDRSHYVAGGAPWFLTLFGRDSLTTSLMAGLDGAWSAEGALSALADYQATQRDDWRDAEPGKLPHEIRRGELAHFGTIPHDAYYGAHDAQALYCLALWHAWRWTGKRELLERHFQTARRALDWCDKLGDRDRDGLQEYQTRSSSGYYNQSWKDSSEAIVDVEGRVARTPLATVELQGYWYAARLAMAELNEELGHAEDAARLRQDAAALRKLVESKYWLADEGFYALALDGAKRRIATITSNPGHLLWCGLCSLARARKVAQRLLQPDLFSGWGLRSLSSKHPSFNPLSYQLGSVWPHDTTLVASGLWRYGLFEAAEALLHAVLCASNVFEQHRLPEVFCGFSREEDFPIPFEKANLPQAWSAAVPVLCAQLFLGIVPDAPRKRCFLSPRLPAWLPRLELRNIKIGAGQLHVLLRRDQGQTRIEVLEAQGIEAVHEQAPAPLWGTPLAT